MYDKEVRSDYAAIEKKIEIYSFAIRDINCFHKQIFFPDLNISILRTENFYK